MYQIYLLAVFANIIGGALVASNFLKGKIPGMETVESFLQQNRAYVTIAALVMIAVGVLKLIVPAAPAAAVAQDLIPALLAILSGITLFYGYYKKVSDVDSEATSFLDTYLYNYRDIIGILTALSGILHFILPRVILI